MKIFLWADPVYFHMCSALIKSIRYHGNPYEITVLLLDFEDVEVNKVQREFERDPSIRFWRASCKDFGFDISDRFQFYRNCRPRYFLQILAEGDSVLTLGSNGIVWRSLEYIEDILKTHDFCFMERTKRIKGLKVKHIHRADEVTNKQRNPLVLAKMVLLGTHAFANNSRVVDTLTRWARYVEDPDVISRQFSDMGFFVRAYLEVDETQGLTKETDWDKPREHNRFVDTHLREDSPIWFAKSRNKWKNPRYRAAVERFNNWSYP